jgi:fatty-acyl-CoA synthase
LRDAQHTSKKRAPMSDLAQEISRSRDRDPSKVPPTLAEALRQLGDRSPERGDGNERGFVFARPDGTERFFCFKDLRIEAEKRAAQMHARGLSKGDRLAIAVPDPDEFVLSFLGAVMGGIVPVPISPQLSFKNIEGYHDTVAHIANASGAALLLTTQTTRQYVEPAAPRVEKLRGILTVDELAATEAPARVDVTIDPTDLAFLQFTSGSTSRPKGVMVTHRNLAWNSQCFMIEGLAKDSSFDKGVTWLPLFHDMGLIGFAIGTVFTDIPVVFLPTASFVRNPRIWLDKIHQHKGTITYAPNFAYQLVTKRIKDKDVAELDLSTLQRAGCGAEPIQARTLREFAAKLAPAKFNPKAFLASYGMAEATLAITFVPRLSGVRTDSIDKAALEKGEAKPGTDQELVNCGKPFPMHAIAVVDENNVVLRDRQVGQIITRGPSVSAGYYNEPELTAEAFKKGPDGETWLYTGDLGYLVDGEVFICGRLKDMIIVRGRNFYPNDLEWVVSELPSVRRGNVVAFSIDVDGAEGRSEQLVIAAEAFQSDAKALEEAIKQAILENFSLNTHEVAIVPQGTLPRTSSGKPQRRKTKQLYLDGTLPRARAVQDSSETPVQPA